MSQGGIPKLAIPSAELTEIGIRRGTRGAARSTAADARRFSWSPSKGSTKLVSQGFPVFPGALGENFTTRNLDRRQLRMGQRLRVGDAEIELTHMRAPCGTLMCTAPGSRPRCTMRAFWLAIPSHSDGA